MTSMATLYYCIFWMVEIQTVQISHMVQCAATAKMQPPAANFIIFILFLFFQTKYSTASLGFVKALIILGNKRKPTFFGDKVEWFCFSRVPSHINNNLKLAGLIIRSLLQPHLKNVNGTKWLNFVLGLYSKGSK